MWRIVGACMLALSLGGCASIYSKAELGELGGAPVTAIWVGPDKFVYVPHPNLPFTFKTANGRPITPGLMYTDGGSIPRAARIFKGFSPWDFGPAYIIHDWIFYARHCFVDPASPDYKDDIRFADLWEKHEFEISFDESALILAQSIKTLNDYGKVPPWQLPGKLISAAVDGSVALALWNGKGACDSMRVEPLTIAVVWLTAAPHFKDRPPASWRLSEWEIRQAKSRLLRAKRIIRALEPMPLEREETPKLSASIQ